MVFCANQWEKKTNGPISIPLLETAISVSLTFTFTVNLRNYIALLSYSKIINERNYFESIWSY
jgi:hypothetical protein